jgi:hypothetical protein
MGAFTGGLGREPTGIAIELAVGVLLAAGIAPERS